MSQTPEPYMKPLILTALLLALATPAFAEEPATQPSKADESPASQPAEKPKPRHNDAPPRKNVPIIIKEAKDVWKLLPEDLRPGKDGKVSDELAEKIKTWAKENKGKFDGIIQFTSTKSTMVSSKTHDTEYTLDLKGNDVEVALKAELVMRDVQKSSPKISDRETLALTIKGRISELKVANPKDILKLTIQIKDPEIISQRAVSKN